MDEVFVYNCPSCGGKVEYINNKWHCTYCNNTYDALFAEENNSAPDVAEALSSQAEPVPDAVFRFQMQPACQCSDDFPA